MLQKMVSTSPSLLQHRGDNPFGDKMDKKTLPDAIKLKYSSNYQKQPPEVSLFHNFEILFFYAVDVYLENLVHLTLSWRGPLSYSHQRCSVRKGGLRNFAKFTGKHLCQSLFFNKACNFIKKRLWNRCFPMNFAKFPRATFFQNTSGRLLLCFVWVDYARWKKRYKFNGCTNRGLCITIRAYHWLHQQQIMHKNLCIPNGFTNRLGITIHAYLMAAPTRDYAYGNDNSKVNVILKINDVWVAKAWELKIHL